MNNVKVIYLYMRKKEKWKKKKEEEEKKTKSAKSLVAQTPGSFWGELG